MSFFFKKFRNQKLTAGFSLVEMLVVVSIFTIVTAVVLANLPSFRDKSSLDLVAQEIAIQIRGAQTYAMSTLYDADPSNTTDSDTTLFAYAVVLPEAGDTQSFKLHYTDSDATADDCTVAETVKESYAIKGNFEIGKVCQAGVKVSSVDICFKRPNGQLWSTNGESADYNIIVWSKADHSKYRYINVANNGQIYVSLKAPDGACSVE